MLRVFTYICIGWVLAAGISMGAPPKARPAQKLSQKKIEQLVAIGTPDEVIAQEIRARGIDFSPTQQTLTELAQHGAAAGTLAALREFIRVGVVEIRAQAGSELLLDNATISVVNSQAEPVSREIPTGPHELVVRKAGYRDGHYPFELASLEHKLLTVQLEWAGGFITVHASPAATTITVEGLGAYQDSVEELQCAPRAYLITAARPGMTAEQQTILLTAGQHANAEFHLKPDREFIEGRLRTALGLLASNASAAIPVTNEVLALDPDSVTAHDLLASAYFMTQDHVHFEITATEALRRSGDVAVPLLHLHGFPKRSLHPVILIISSGTIAFDPEPALGACKTRPFHAPLQKLQALDVVRNESGEVLLVMKLSDPNSSNRAIAKVMTFDFATADSQLVRTNMPEGTIFTIGPTPSHIGSSPNAQALLQSLTRVVNFAAQRRAQ
ncbi:MAG: hypothetical protein P4L40_03750 [Terracidiphilus sp.]|nr:hypothetical protein [Terracidiphilus sp.]